MPSPFSIFSRKRPTRQFKSFFADWSKILAETLDLLRRSLSSVASAAVISSQVDALLRHIVLYYETLDLAADPNTIPYLLFPSSWRNPLETPFMFLGDLHPYLFTNLIRSFVDRENNDEDDEKGGFWDVGLDRIEEEKPWKIAMAWKDPSEELMNRVDQIECAMRLMVPDLVGRIRTVQGRLVGRVAEEWVSSREGKKKMIVEEAVKEEMEEMVSIFVDANRLRKSVIMDIVAATSEYQAALFLEGLSQFLVGFRDPALLGEFERCTLQGNNGGSSRETIT